MQREDDIITFETFYDPMLAQIIRTKLEANGIPCFISDENLGPLYPMYNQGAGGIKLKIFARDLERCKQLVAEDSELPQNFEVEPGSDNVVICPFCGSTNTYYEPPNTEKTTWIDDMVSAVDAINPLHADKNWHCNDCHQNFE